LNSTKPGDITLHICANPLQYRLGFSIAAHLVPTWLASIQSLWQAFTPTNWFVFEGNSFVLFASGNSEPWPFDGPEVGFAEVMEEDIPDCNLWTK